MVPVCLNVCSPTLLHKDKHLHLEEAREEDAGATRPCGDQAIEQLLEKNWCSSCN